MGIYLNPGNLSFQESIDSEIYVDKTGLLVYLNQMIGTRQKNICISRPRRFGKSMAAEMLSAYYSCGCDSKQLFDGLSVSKAVSFEKYLNKYNVLFFNIQDFVSRAENMTKVIPYLQKMVIRELQETYGEYFDENETHLAIVLEQLFAKTGMDFVFIVDEWDCIFREKKSNADLQKEYLDFLRTLLKDKPYVRLAYMTGILPIKKYGTHSALNMFEEYSMTNADMVAEYVGFTEAEVLELCKRYDMDFTEVQRWYDGYLFDGNLHIYNPKSVVDAMRRRKLSSYWTQTETYEALKVYIDMNHDGLRDAVTLMLGGGRCKINTRTFQNDMTTFKSRDDVLTLLIHLGYLAYDERKQEVFIPNQEIEGEYANAVEGAGWKNVIHAIAASEELLEATLRLDCEMVAKGIEAVHMDNISIISYNNENSLSCVISLAYYSARNYYCLKREMPAGRGFADIVFVPRKEWAADRPALLVELKWNSSAESAIRQIKRTGYVEALKEYEGDILLVGINYDKSNKRHECVIEQYKLKKEYI